MIDNFGPSPESIVVGEWFRLLFLCPAFDFCEGGRIGEKTEQHDGENGQKTMRLSALGARIRHFFEALHEDSQGSRNV